MVKLSPLTATFLGKYWFSRVANQLTTLVMRSKTFKVFLLVFTVLMKLV